MSLHTLTLSVKRFMQCINEEVAEAAEMHRRSCSGDLKATDQDQRREGARTKDPAAARPIHPTLFGV
jgi:hypothetical protein